MTDFPEDEADFLATELPAQPEADPEAEERIRQEADKNGWGDEAARPSDA